MLLADRPRTSITSFRRFLGFRVKGLLRVFWGILGFLRVCRGSVWAHMVFVGGWGGGGGVVGLIAF